MRFIRNNPGLVEWINSIVYKVKIIFGRKPGSVKIIIFKTTAVSHEMSQIRQLCNITTIKNRPALRLGLSVKSELFTSNDNRKPMKRKQFALIFNRKIVSIMFIELCISNEFIECYLEI